MEGDSRLFAFVSTYNDPADADADYDAVKRLHAEGVIGTYDAAVVTKDQRDRVHVHKHEKPTQHGAWSGLAVGALLGLLFPPGIIAGGIIGATAGGLMGHYWKGMSRGDLKELGETLDEGQAALVVIGKSELEQAMAKTLKRANKMLEKQVNADAAAFRKELDREIDQALAGT